MSEMNHESFRDACDALSSKVDAEQFERFRWQRDEAPKLKRLVELIKESVADRTDLEINEEGGELDSKRFVIKVHGQRIAALAVALQNGRAVMSAGPIERSEYKVASGDPVHASYDKVDAEWIGKALGKLFARISS